MRQLWFREGIPVVARFLSELLDRWNGSDLFLDVVALVQYIQITDFDEVYNCILR